MTEQTNARLRGALVRLRVIAIVYGVAWIATPATFFALVIAEPSFAVLRVADADNAAASVGLMFAFAFVAVLWISPVFVWALATASRAAGGSHAYPLLLGASTFVVPYFPLGVFVVNATSTLARRAGDGARAVPGFLAWAGALLVAPTVFFMGISTNADMRDPPASVLVLCGALIAYAISRILIARRVFHLCREILMQRDVDAIRASHADPVGGG